MAKKNPNNRSFSHGVSQKKLISRTQTDNVELGEYTAETFTNRNGGIVPDDRNDIPKSTVGKKPSKPKSGTRSYKGADSIRKADLNQSQIFESTDPDEVTEMIIRTDALVLNMYTKEDLETAETIYGVEYVL